MRPPMDSGLLASHFDSESKPRRFDSYLSSVFSVDDLFADPDYQTGDFTPVYDSSGFALKIYDKPKHSRVILEFTEYGVDYVVVKFDAPGNPPSNDVEYLYLAN